LLFDIVGLLGGDRLWGGNVDDLGDRFIIEIRERSLLGVVGLLRCDRLLGKVWMIEAIAF